MKTINPFELSNTNTVERTNENDQLQLFYSEATNKFHVVFNAVTMATYKARIHAVKFANKLVFKHQLA